MASGEIELKKALLSILERYAVANQRRREIEWDQDAGLVEKARAAAEVESLATEYFVLSHELGETLLCLLRHTIDKQPDVLRELLMRFLAPDIGRLITKTLSERDRHGS